MKIGELATRTGVSVRALRYYEDRGLLRPRRTASGHRVFQEDAVDRVLFIQQLFSAGLASRTVVSIFPCVDSGRLTEGQRELLRGEARRLKTQIAALQRARELLLGLISNGPAD